jgi:hypothetical protein
MGVVPDDEPNAQRGVEFGRDRVGRPDVEIAADQVLAGAIGTQTAGPDGRAAPTEARNPGSPVGGKLPRVGVDGQREGSRGGRRKQLGQNERPEIAGSVHTVLLKIGPLERIRFADPERRYGRAVLPLLTVRQPKRLKN